MGKVCKALNKAGVHRPEEKDDTGNPDHAPAAGVSAADEQPRDGGPGKSVVPPAAGSWDERLLLATATAGGAAESFRNLRTRILHPPGGDTPRTLLVTSATPGEGKSFVCANLGISLAQGLDTYSLLVDCDLRKPTLHAFFGLGNRHGLADHLRDGRDVGPMFVNCGIRKLSLLPAGPPPVNPAELVGARTMTSLVREFADRYDDRIIIFDSPPVQAASETLILAKQVDGIILVVRWGGSRREHVQDLLDLVGRDKIVAVVFNAYRATVFDTRLFGAYEYQREYSYGASRADGT